MTDTAVAQKRADARRNRAALVDAATACLAANPAASLNEIAAAADVGRVTLYGHFANRAALIAEAVDQAMAVAEAEFAEVDIDGDSELALARLVDASWHVTHRFGGLIAAAETALPQHRLDHAHNEPVQRMRRLLRRARSDGTVRTDMPVDWQITTVQAVIHAASGAVHRGRLNPDRAPVLVRKTIMSALTLPISERDRGAGDS